MEWLVCLTVSTVVNIIIIIVIIIISVSSSSLVVMHLCCIRYVTVNGSKRENAILADEHFGIFVLLFC